MIKQLFARRAVAWWQVSVLKLTMLSLGLLLGAYFVDVVNEARLLLLGIFIIGAVYLTVAWWRLPVVSD